MPKSAENALTPPAAKAVGKLDRMEALSRLARLASASGDPQLVELASLIDDFIDGGAEGTLDRAFGLRTQGGSSTPRTIAQTARDRQLVALWRRVPEWRDLSPWAASCLMSASAKRYEATGWPRDRAGADLPSVEPAATWWRILRSGQRIPAARRLQQILEPASGDEAGL